MKRLSIAFMILISILSFGGCFHQDTVDPPLLIHSGGHDWEPYVNFLNAGSYSENGWLAADGYSISRQFPDVIDKLPEITYFGDFSLIFGKSAHIISIDIYDSNLYPLHQKIIEPAWEDLSPGTYYLVVTAKVQGRYIAVEEKHESTGYEYACKLVIPTAS